jgi:hypothetical protein
LFGDGRRANYYVAKWHQCRYTTYFYSAPDTIPRRLYEVLSSTENRLWHSHAYEVTSGMLVMSNRVVPQTVWDAAEMEEIITSSGALTEGMSWR